LSDLTGVILLITEAGRKVNRKHTTIAPAFIRIQIESGR